MGTAALANGKSAQSLKQSLEGLRTQESHLVGELHFVRTKEDIVHATISIMQSIKVTMQGLQAVRQKHASVQKQTLLHSLPRLELELARIIKHLNAIFLLLQALDHDSLDSAGSRLCIPATALACEAVARVMTSLAANIWLLALEPYQESNLALVITQVTFNV